MRQALRRRQWLPVGVPGTLSAGQVQRQESGNDNDPLRGLYRAGKHCWMRASRWTAVGFARVGYEVGNRIVSRTTEASFQGNSTLSKGGVQERITTGMGRR